MGALHQLLISGDPYPQLPHLAGALGMELIGGLAGVRASNLLLHAVHLLLALRLGPALFGRAGAVLYALLVTLSPILLAWQRSFFIDLALTEAVGCAALLLWSSDGLRAPRATAGFGLAAAAGMLTKWVFALLLGVPAALTLGGALLGLGGRRGRRAGAAVGLPALAGVAYLLWLGQSPWRGVISAEGPLAGLALGLMAVGGLLGLGGALLPRRPLPGARGLALRGLLVIGVVLLIAGPFYALAMPQLFGRLALEQGVHADLTTRTPLRWSLDVAQALLPAGGPLLVGALALTGLRDRARFRRALGAASGAVFSFGLLTWALPFDPRYLLPLLPLLAGAVSSAVPALGRLGGPLTGGLALVLAWQSLGQLWPEPRVAADGLIGAAVELDAAAGLPVARLAARTRRPGVAAEVHKLVEAVAAACPPGGAAHFDGPIQGAVQGRGVEALLLMAGHEIAVKEGGPAEPGALLLRAACHPDGPPAAPAGCALLAAPRVDCAVWSCGRAGEPGAVEAPPLVHGPGQGPPPPFIPPRAR